MVKPAAPASATPTAALRLSALLACLLLGMGLFRLFSLVLHDPLLGYGNSYDMVRLQSCHQVWPAKKGISINQATPEGPLRQYRLLTIDADVHCMPSSELLFTSIAVYGSKLANLVRGGQLVSMASVGFTKAVALAALALAISLLFYRQQRPACLVAHAVLFALVLTDPGITLYLNTFYSEFSAVFFLYGLLAMLAIYAAAPASRPLFWCMGIALCGFALSKPQHLPLAMLLGLLLFATTWRQHRWRVVPVMLGLVLSAQLHVGSAAASRNDIMRLANTTNTLGMLLGYSSHLPATLSAAGLPASCRTLAGAQWEGQKTLDNPPCPEIRGQAHEWLALRILAAEPAITWLMLQHSIPLLKDWTLLVYGNVEGKKFASVSLYFPHLWEWLRLWPDKIFIGMFVMPAALVLALLLLQGSGLVRVARWLPPWLLVVTGAQWTVLFTALLGDGLFDLSKHAHLALPLALTAWAGLLLIPFHRTDNH